MAAEDLPVITRVLMDSGKRTAPIAALSGAFSDDLRTQAGVVMEPGVSTKKTPVPNQSAQVFGEF